MAGKLSGQSVAKTRRPDSQLEVSVSGTPEDGQTLLVESEDALQKIFGTKHPEMAEGLLSHCLKVLGDSECSDEYSGNDERMFMLTTVAEIEPRDTFERMLSVQMAATHVAMMRAARRLANSGNVEQSQAYCNGYTKLCRAYTGQMEALRKHRNGGKQTVTVQHVNVEDGGQAIVGTVETGGRVSERK